MNATPAQMAIPLQMDFPETVGRCNPAHQGVRPKVHFEGVDLESESQ
jgi:hypothetical protein